MATPTTPRAALIDLADRIDAGQIDRLPDASLVRLAGLLRRDADRYPDEPETSPTGPRPTTARAALIAFADELDDILDPAVIPPATIATITHMARERARSLPDGPDAPQPIETYGVELVGTPSLDVDQQIRVHALDAAARFCTSPPDTIADVVDVAHTFEDYLRGDR